MRKHNDDTIRVSDVRNVSGVSRVSAMSGVTEGSKWTSGNFVNLRGSLRELLIILSKSAKIYL